VPSYCCFFCPVATYNDNALTDLCPSCTRAFGFPLSDGPAEIGPFKILRPLEHVPADLNRRDSHGLVGGRIWRH
jgi:hypothetical protein